MGRALLEISPVLRGKKFAGEYMTICFMYKVSFLQGQTAKQIGETFQGGDARETWKPCKVYIIKPF